MIEKKKRKKEEKESRQRQGKTGIAYFCFFFGVLRRVRYFAVGSLTLPGSWLFNAS
jgi:hypothetical protein